MSWWLVGWMFLPYDLEKHEYIKIYVYINTYV